MQTAPKNLRLHIGIFGRRNVGKSSLLNAVTGQEIAIVSPEAGTTTDPVEKPMELPGIGPALFIDTAGIDDEGALGARRIARTREVFARADIALLVTDGVWGEYEETLARELGALNVPVINVFNKSDLGARAPARAGVAFSAKERAGVEDLLAALLAAAPDTVLNQAHLVADILPPRGAVVLVIPVDKEAPQGRIILPQVMTLRNLLDYERVSVVTTVGKLPETLQLLREPPCLVVTDSQAFAEVAAAVPGDIPLTGFSVLFARCMGDLPTQAAGARAIRDLRPGDKVLVAEGCSHHPGGEDIGRVKIPRLLQKKAGGELQFEHVQGHGFPADLSPYRLVIMCGGCMNNRREILGRILRCRAAGVPISNYGLAIAECLGILERALAPFRLTEK